MEQSPIQSSSELDGDSASRNDWGYTDLDVTSIFSKVLQPRVRTSLVKNRIESHCAHPPSSSNPSELWSYLFLDTPALGKLRYSRISHLRSFAASTLFDLSTLDSVMPLHSWQCHLRSSLQTNLPQIETNEDKLRMISAVSDMCTYLTTSPTLLPDVRSE
jgi:hypothetical protein